MALFSVTSSSFPGVTCCSRERGYSDSKQRCRISTWHNHEELEEAKLLCPSTAVQSQILLGREDLTQNTHSQKVHTPKRGKKDSK